MEYRLDNAYLKKVSNAIVIIPDSAARTVHYFKEIGDGRLDLYKLTLKDYICNSKNESSKIKSLIDEKVIFMPLQTEVESAKWMEFKDKTNRALLEFEITQVGSGIEKVSKRRAIIYNPLTKNDAEYIIEFVKTHTYRTRSFNRRNIHEKSSSKKIYNQEPLS